MNTAIFNFHDLILLMTALQCVFFASLLLVTRPPGGMGQQDSRSTILLSAFLLAHALIPVHELFMYAELFKYKARDEYTQIYFVFSAAYYVDAVALYFYTKSLIFRDFRFKWIQLGHFVPLLLFAVFLYLVFYQYSPMEREDIVKGERLLYSDEYSIADFFCKLIRAAYCGVCFALVIKYQNTLKATHSNIESNSFIWLRILIVGFFLVTLMELLLTVAKLYALFIGTYDFYHFKESALLEYLGLIGYYLLFGLINVLVFTSTRYFANFEKVTEPSDSTEVDSAPAAMERWMSPDIASKIETAMVEKKPYLNSEITLATLAEQLEIPAKDLSSAINRLFDKNFYEFVNFYRIEDAKARLSSEEHSRQSIVEIYTAVGFNSKSVFNTFFKKDTGMTPSAYRRSAKS